MSTDIHPTARRQHRLALAVALLFGLSAVFTLAVPSATFAWSTEAFDSGSEADLVSLTNRSRASAGLKALKVDSTLKSVARWRSKDMIDRDYFSHTIPGFGKVWDKLHDIGYCYKVAGENIGWNNYPDDIATAAIHSMFMDSPGHRANVLGKTWDVVGIGAYKGPTGKKMWTVIFADKCGSTPAPAPKPTVKPKPKPTVKPAPKPTVKPAPKPAANPTTAPAVATTPAPTPEQDPGRPRPWTSPRRASTRSSQARNRRPGRPARNRPMAMTATAPSRCGWSIGPRQMDCSRRSSVG